MGKEFESHVFDGEGPGKGMKQRAEELARGLVHELIRCGAKETPLLWFYSCGVSSTFLVMRHFEHVLFSLWEAATSDREADLKKDREALLTEALGKTQERWRKAMKDVEDYLEKTGSPTDIALSDLMKPILKKADGVLEDALEYEAGKRKAKRSRKAGSEPKS